MEDILLHSEEYILKVKEHMDYCDYIKAKRLLTELLEEQPDHGRAHQLLGWIYASELNQYNDAELHLKMAMQFDPGHAATYSDYMYLLKMTGRYNEMVSFARKAEKLNGVNLVYILYYKAVAYEMLNDYGNAINTYRRAITSSLDDEWISKCEQGMARINKKMTHQEQLSYLSNCNIA